MFDFVHKYRRAIQVFLFLIALTFMTWGIESYTQFRGQRDEIASVNGSSITQREFDQELRNQQDRMRQMFGGRIDPAMLDTPETRKALLDNLIAQRVVSTTAAKSNLMVSDEVLRDTITSIPAFQANGQFSRANYEQILKAQNPPMTPAQFEARMRHDLALNQLARAVGETSIVPRTVAARVGSLETQQRDVAEAAFRAEQYMGQVKVDEAKLKAHYEANQGDYRVPERIRAEYVMLSADQLARAEPPTEAEIKAAYEARASQFKVDEQRRASHILVKTREEAAKIAEDLKKNPKAFAELAKKHSQDPGSAEKGGDLGLFGRGMMVKPFEEAAFAMKEGETSGPVQSEFGWHIIRVTGIQAGKARPYEEAKKEIAEDLTRQKGQRKFAESAEAFTNLVYEQPDSLKPAADKFKLQVQTTGWVTKSSNQELGALDNPKLLSALFSQDSIKNRRNTDAVEVAQNTLVAARVVEHQPAAQRKFEEVKDEIEKTLRRREAAELAQKEGAAKLEQLKKGENAGVKWSETRTVSRRQPQGAPPEILRLILSADTTKLPAYVGMPVPDAGYLLLRISKVTEGERKEKDPELDMRMQQVFGTAEYQAYVAALRDKADISTKATPEAEKK